MWAKNIFCFAFFLFFLGHFREGISPPSNNLFGRNETPLPKPPPPLFCVRPSRKEGREDGGEGGRESGKGGGGGDLTKALEERRAPRVVAREGKEEEQKEGYTKRASARGMGGEKGACREAVGGCQKRKKS
jgi:hypothetical protein